MKKIKQTSYEKGLVKAHNLNDGLRVRDYYGVHIHSDMIGTHLKALKEFVDVRVGDHIEIVSFTWKSRAHKDRARRNLARLLKKLRARK